MRRIARPGATAPIIALVQRLAALVMLAGSPFAAALDPALHLTQFGHTAWRTEDGAFAEPMTVTQTRDGYLWVGTVIGIVRFDGQHFASWPGPAASDASEAFIGASLAAQDGSLWFGADRSLFHYQDGRLSRFDVRGRVEGLIDTPHGLQFIRARVADNDGPLCTIIDAHMACQKPSGVPFQWATAILPNGDGTSESVWIGSSEGVCRTITNRSPQCLLPPALHGSRLSGVTALARDGLDRTWVGFGQSGPTLGLKLIVDGALTSPTIERLDASRLAIHTLLVDRAGALWIATANSGIYRVANDKAEHFGAAEGLSSDRANAIFEDAEGNIWVATSNGLDLFRTLPVLTYSSREGLAADTANTALPARDGRVWVGNYETLDVIDKGRTRIAIPTSGLGGGRLTSMYEDHQGRLWVGIDGALSRIENNHLHRVDPQFTETSGVIYGLTEDGDGTLWAIHIGQRHELLRVRNDHIESVLEGAITAVAPDGSNGLLLGYRDGSVARFVGDTTTRLIPSDRGLETVTGLWRDPDGTILVSSLRGLAVYRHQQTLMLDTLHGLPCDSIRSLVRDRDRTLWLSASCGLVAIKPLDLDRWLLDSTGSIPVRTIGALDGLRISPASFSPNLAVSVDNRLWLANGNVVQTFDPHAVMPEGPLPVHIETIRADHRPIALADTISFRRKPKDLEIGYTAISLSAPAKVIFEYQLDGHDTAWVATGSRRQAVYADLAPGRYRFRVRASLGDDRWTEVAAPLSLSIPPSFHETFWFRSLAAAVVVALAWLAYAVRTRQLSMRIADRYRIRLAERERIARELHDTLLQGTQGLILQVQSATLALPESHPVHDLLSHAMDLADDVVAEGRDRINDLRASSDASISLREAISAFAVTLNAGHNIRFEVTETGIPRQLREVVDDDVLQIGREAISNAIRHAQASSIDIGIAYGPPSFALTIKDNGCGIETSILAAGSKPGHWGLRGLRERAQRIGGTLTITSEEGSGTTVEFRLDCARAYPETRAGWGALFAWRGSQPASGLHERH